jgi:hypothetical protein
MTSEEGSANDAIKQVVLNIRAMAFMPSGWNEAQDADQQEGGAKNEGSGLHEERRRSFLVRVVASPRA